MKKDFYEAYTIIISYLILSFMAYILISTIFFVLASITWIIVGSGNGWQWVLSLNTFIKWPLIVTYFFGMVGILMILTGIIASFIHIEVFDGNYYM